jgi:hypothetical protein
LEPAVLPLNETDMERVAGIEPAWNGLEDRRSANDPHTQLETRPGFEPGPQGFADLCIAILLARHSGREGWNRTTHALGFNQPLYR